MSKIKKGRHKDPRPVGPLSMLYAILVYAFLYVPVLVIIFFSFNTSKRNILFEGFTLEWYVKMFDNTRLMESFYNTITVAVVSTLVAVVIGTLCAVGLFKFEFKLKALISNTLYIPIAIPEIIFGISLLIFFSSLNIEPSMLTLVISHITFSVPFVVITVRSRISGFDKAMEEAAQDLGANEFRTFFRVTLPNIMPGIIAGGMLAMTLSLDDVVISSFTSGPDSTTMPIRILGMVKRGISPDVNALSTVLILGAVLIMVLANVFEARMEKKRGENEH